jgi:hypothetical protein
MAKVNRPPAAAFISQSLRLTLSQRVLVLERESLKLTLSPPESRLYETYFLYARNTCVAKGRQPQISPHATANPTPTLSSANAAASRLLKDRFSYHDARYNDLAR